MMDLVEKIKYRIRSIKDKFKHSYDEARYDNQLGKVTYNIWFFLTVAISIIGFIAVLTLLFFIIGLVGTLLGIILRLLIIMFLIFTVLVLIATV